MTYFCSNLSKRSKYKPPFLHGRMWYNELWLVDNLVSIQENVNVNGTRLPFFLSNPSKGIFDSKNCGKENVWIERCVDSNGLV